MRGAGARTGNCGRRLLAILAFAAAWGAALPGAAGELAVSAEQLGEKGIRLDRFVPVGLSPGGRCLVGCEKTTDLGAKVAGFVFRLKLLHFGEEGLDRVTEVPLPVTQLTGGALGGDRILIAGDFGNKMLFVDLKSLEVTTRYEYRRGSGGLKVRHVWANEGTFHAEGWEFDREQYWVGDYLVRVEPGGRAGFDPATLPRTRVDGLAARQQRELGDGMPGSFRHLTHDRFLFTWLSPAKRTTHLRLHERGETVTLLRGFHIPWFRAARGVVVCAVTDEDRRTRTLILDPDAPGEAKRLGSDRDRFLTALLSEDGAVLWAVREEEGQEYVSLLRGVRKEGYSLEEIAAGVPRGALLVSNDGECCAVVSRGGIRVIGGR